LGIELLALVSSIRELGTKKKEAIMKSLAVLSSLTIALIATPAVAKSTHHRHVYVHTQRYGYTFDPSYNRPYNYYAPYGPPNEVGTTYVPGFGNIGAGAGPGEDWK
jgi:hypothetical protein